MSDHGGQIWDAEGRCALRLDFSANIWPERGVCLPRGARRWLEPYPDSECRALLRAASVHYQMPEAWMLAVSGATEGLDLAMRALRPSRLAVFAPTFSEYENAAKRAAADASVQVLRLPMLPEDDFSPHLRVPPVDAIVIGNPNNPTGGLLTREHLAPWLDECGRSGLWVIVDEAFMDFVREPERHSLLREMARWPHLIVLRSMTKRFGIAGVRLGFAFAAPDMIARLRALQTPWSVHTLAQRVGAALAQRPHDAGFASRIAAERGYLSRGLRRLGYRVFPAEANFVLLKMPGEQLNHGLIAFLREQGIGLRDASTFIGLDRTYLRCAVRPRREARQLLRALEGWR